jgi:hypothetical protein
VSAARPRPQRIVCGGVHAHSQRLKENLMGRMVAAIVTSVLLAASFVDVASAGWSW